VLLNNAGGVFNKRELTVDGIEKTFATNHLTWSRTSRASVGLMGSPRGLEQRMARGSDGGSD
jgi:NAD(P)-dependent dehydrogenase (short-subunit alcohol dehydrogenase family)